MRYSSRGGQVNYNEDENDWGISSEDDDKLPVYTKPAVVEDEGDVIESVHDFRRMENTGLSLILCLMRHICSFDPKDDFLKYKPSYPLE